MNREYGKANGIKYDYQILHYYIKIEDHGNYLVILRPPFEGDYVEIKVDSYGISLFGLLGIILAIIVLVLGIIFIVYYYRKRKKNNITLPNQENLILNRTSLIQEENHDEEMITSNN